MPAMLGQVPLLGNTTFIARVDAPTGIRISGGNSCSRCLIVLVALSFGFLGLGGLDPPRGRIPSLRRVRDKGVVEGKECSEGLCCSCGHSIDLG